MNRTKVLLAPASSAYKHSLKEVFNVPGIASQIKVRTESVGYTTDTWLHVIIRCFRNPVLGAAYLPGGLCWHPLRQHPVQRRHVGH